MTNDKKSSTKSSKTETKTSIVFFGSGPVAAESLRLLSQDFDIESVVTKPTTKHEMTAVAGDAPVHCVSDRKELDLLFTTESFTSTVSILIDFGIIVSQKIIDFFPKGIINSHFSLLPELRGADPISFAILEGRDTTGVSLMLLVQAMDEGPILAVAEEPLHGDETTPSLTKNLIQLSYILLKDIVPDYVLGTKNENSGVIPTPKSQETVCTMLKRPFTPTYTRKLTKLDGAIDWNKSATQLDREVRAYLGWPKSQTTLGSIDCVITKASIIELEKKDEPTAPGKIFVHDKQLAVRCIEDALLIDKLKPAGKQEMDSQGFLAGYKSRLGI